MQTIITFLIPLVGIYVNSVSSDQKSKTIQISTTYKQMKSNNLSSIE